MFWQITDIHWDLRYSQTGDPTEMCHDKTDGSSNLSRNGEYGTHSCDSPWPLVHSAFQAMKGINNKPDFILWTG